MMKNLLYNLRLLLYYRDALRCNIPCISRLFISGFRKSQFRAAQRLRDKEIIDVAFQLTSPNMWKLDPLFRLMQGHPRFHPYIVVTPMTYLRHSDAKEVQSTVQKTQQYVEQLGYECVVPYDEQGHRWLDFKKMLHPDIVFFAFPYKDTPPHYFIYHFRNTLTCYVPYAFTAINFLKLNYGLIFHSLVGIYMVESSIHRDIAIANSLNKGANVVVTGYPGIEVYLRKDHKPIDVWNPQAGLKKRIIWAPHHTIDGGGDLSTFLLYCDDMIRLARKYSNSVQFAFKPHHVLKLKLHKLWGEERTEEYYRQWREMENTQLEEGDYIDLFLTSDAIMHDCGSFTTEYLFTRKPAMYLMRDENMDNRFNDFGKLAFAQYYNGRSIEDIEHFIEHVVVAGDDPMADSRNKFYEDYLYSEQMPSERILAAIEELIYKA